MQTVFQQAREGLTGRVDATGGSDDGFDPVADRLLAITELECVRKQGKMSRVIRSATQKVRHAPW